MRARNGKFKVVGEDEPERAPDYAKDIYAEARAAALDLDRWRLMHERSARREAIFLPDRPRVRRLGLVYREQIGG